MNKYNKKFCFVRSAISSDKRTSRAYAPIESLFNKKIWTIDDVRIVTGFSKGTIYNKTSRDEIPHRKRGRRLFFFPDEILNWVDEGD